MSSRDHVKNSANEQVTIRLDRFNRLFKTVKPKYLYTPEEATEAIRARKSNDLTHPLLQRLGPLLNSEKEDIGHIRLLTDVSVKTEPQLF